MVGVLDLPEDLSVPVHLERSARLEAWPGLEALEVLHDLAGVEEMAVVEQVTVGPWAIRQPPRVHGRAVHVDEVDGPVAEHRGEQRIALERARRVVGNEARSRAPYTLLVDAHCADYRRARCLVNRDTVASQRAGRLPGRPVHREVPRRRAVARRRAED